MFADSDEIVKPIPTHADENKKRLIYKSTQLPINLMLNTNSDTNRIIVD